MQADRIFVNARLATMAPESPGLGLVEPGMVAEAGGRILYAGPPQKIDALEMIDCAGRWITPGLIDCHTHAVYAGDRAAEFERRLQGASYTEIAAAGGGIAATVRATRAARDSVLAVQTLPRIGALVAEGVTTIEIKSGYGLSLESELRILSAIRKFGRIWPLDVAATFLGAHALPPEFMDDRAGYIDLICKQMIPQIAEEKLAPFP
jgi:imidazolonepropionase